MLNKTYENNLAQVAVSNALKKAWWKNLVKLCEQNVDLLIVCEIFGISSPGWMLLAPTARQSISRWRLTR